jgi:hypothetical protein
VPAKYLYARPGTHQIVKKLGLSSYTDACRPLPAATPIAMARATAPSTFSLAFARSIFWLPAGQTRSAVSAARVASCANSVVMSEVNRGRVGISTTSVLGLIHHGHSPTPPAF